MGDTGSDYEFGSADDELARLDVEGRVLAPATRMIFAAAGMRAGMRVLDLGCGVGDVAFVAAVRQGRAVAWTLPELSSGADQSGSRCMCALLVLAHGAQGYG
jgi:hypothetical protein